MAGVIFNRPVRFGNINYPVSRRSVEVDDKHLDTPFAKALLASGEISIPQAVKEESKKIDAAPAPVKQGKGGAPTAK